MKKNKKKNLVRIVAALLVAMLALTLIPLGAFAVDAHIYEEVYNKQKPTFNDYLDSLNDFPVTDGSTVKAKDFEQHIIGSDGNLYDFSGVASLEKYIKECEKIENSSMTDDQKIEAYIKLGKTFKLNFVKQDIKIDDFPTTGKSEDEQKWYNKWATLIAGYTPHKHKLSAWYSDGTTHWRQCLVCKKYPEFYEKFMYQNWCQDGDEDGICNVCGGDVPYHDITVIESEGGKITLNRDNASYRTKITADVEVEEGYKLKTLHFFKVREDGSKQEITRHKKNGQFWTLMPTYELEVSAEFIKK